MESFLLHQVFGSSDFSSLYIVIVVLKQKMMAQLAQNLLIMVSIS